MKNTHGGVLILVKLQAEAYNFIKINTLPWVFFAFFKLYKCYQIAQLITNMILQFEYFFLTIFNGRQIRNMHTTTNYVIYTEFVTMIASNFKKKKKKYKKVNINFVHNSRGKQDTVINFETK